MILTSRFDKLIQLGGSYNGSCRRVNTQRKQWDNQLW